MVSDKKIFEISANENTLWTLGSHVGIQISTKNTNLVEDHPMNIYGKFGWNLFNGFREEELNQMWKANGRTDSYPWQKLSWPMARWAKKKQQKKNNKQKPTPKFEKNYYFFSGLQNKIWACEFSCFTGPCQLACGLKTFRKDCWSPRCNSNIVESSIKHHNRNPNYKTI